LGKGRLHGARIEDGPNHLSTGVSLFEQFKTDLDMRDVTDIDVPVLIIGSVE